VGVNSTHLDNSNLKAPHHNQQRLPIVVRLSAQGSVVVLVIALGWWGMADVGSSTLALQSKPLTAHQDPIYVAGCPVPDPLQKSSRRGGVVEGKGGCSEEDLSHLINTSRRPRGALEGHALPTQRQREDKLSQPTSENMSSRLSGD
jgi:hypothetical protein